MKFKSGDRQYRQNEIDELIVSLEAMTHQYDQKTQKLFLEYKSLFSNSLKLLKAVRSAKKALHHDYFNNLISKIRMEERK